MLGIRRGFVRICRTVRGPAGIIRRAIQRQIRFQSATSSFEEHHWQYQEYSLDEVKERYQSYQESNLFNHPQNRFADLIARHDEVRSAAVDIGCGGGWLSARLSQDFRRVVAIEPSSAGLAIARQLYPPDRFPNIEWVEGFAEDELPRISLDAQALFVTATVLSHLPDDAVVRICGAIEQVAPVGSILSFAECWGPRSHQFMWHVRTPEWWQEHLASWELDFHGPPIENVPGRHKGFLGYKR